MSNEEYFFKPIEMRLIRARARKMQLDAPKAFWRWSNRHLREKCNGCGPEGWCREIRELASDLLSMYSPAFAIHDIDYSIHEVDRKTADKRMLKNMRKIWRSTYSWCGIFTTQGRWARAVIKPIYLAVRAGGASAWEQGAGEDEQK
jgi:hypothetical protein